jgi:hypothetical protein
MQMSEVETGLDHRNLYHVSLRVDDVEAAMRLMSRRYDLSWAPVHEWPLLAWIPARDPVEFRVTATYSLDGPVHVELSCHHSSPVSSRSDLVAPHHVGYWCEDVTSTTDALTRLGWTLEYRAGPAGGQLVSMLRTPSGYRVELVPAASRPAVEQWLQSAGTES